MLYVRCALHLLIALALSAPAHAAASASIDEYCRGTFPDSYVMQESCQRNETTAQQRLQSRTVDPGIWKYCQRNFEKSWSMMESCVKSEEAAKVRLGR